MSMRMLPREAEVQKVSEEQLIPEDRVAELTSNWIHQRLDAAPSRLAFLEHCELFDPDTISPQM
jgi:hypothetical protein